ncbi:hypothetical protein GCM10023219_29390 [Stakelama sediminis]
MRHSPLSGSYDLCPNVVPQIDKLGCDEIRIGSVLMLHGGETSHILDQQKLWLKKLNRFEIAFDELISGIVLSSPAICRKALAWRPAHDQFDAFSEAL